MKKYDRYVIGVLLAAEPYIFSMERALNSKRYVVARDWRLSTEEAVERINKINGTVTDLCNMRVLCDAVKKEVGDGYGELIRCCKRERPSELFDTALNALRKFGYGVKRVHDEFTYIFRSMEAYKPEKQAKKDHESLAGLSESKMAEIFKESK